MPVLDDSPRRTEQVIRTFLTGVVAILPLALTVAVLIWVVTLVHDLAGPTSLCGRALRSLGMSVVACDVTAYIIGVIGAILMVFGLGLLIQNNAGKRLRLTMHEAMRRVPVLGTVYDASKQVTSIFDRKPDSRQNMTPVMCYFGDELGAGVPALMPTPELVRLGDNEYHIVIIPTAPVPFGGALLCVKADWVKPAECGLEDLIGIYVSMGVSAPRCLGRGSRETEEAQRAPRGLS
jgi:uncharacterized membrane protein